ncbi:MAG: DUF3240 family protein [Gammaproteobacteria bacterium]|jgi:hypothetical protein|nr:DUF3240 family protein [Gammaproteobacteria bacterium]
MSLVQLTLVAPRRLEDALVEGLLANPEWTTGFTMAWAEGHGTRGEVLSVQEEVRGRADRCVVQVVIEAQLAQQLIDKLKAALPAREVIYWILPVTAMGRLA